MKPPSVCFGHHCAKGEHRSISLLLIGQPQDIETNQEVEILGNTHPPPYIVWVKDKEIVIIGKQGQVPQVGEPQEAVRGRREAQEVPENQWVPEVQEVQVHTETTINTILTTVQANL